MKLLKPGDRKRPHALFRRMAGMMLLWTPCIVCAASMDFSGEYRNLAFATRDTRQQQTYNDLNRLRLKMDGQRKRLQWNLTYDLRLFAGGLLEDPLFRLQAEQPEPTWADAEDTWHQSSRALGRHALYRGWLAWDQEDWRLAVGRQRLAWGSGRIWNPTDRFNPVQPTALELDEKVGVDAAVATWRYSGFGSFALILAPGNGARDVSRKWAFRWQDTFGETDLSLMAGEIGPERVAGLDITGNVGDATARLEALYSRDAPEGDFAQLIAGVDYTWSNKIFPEGLYLAAEYFYNGAAASLLLPHTQDRLFSISTHQLGLLAGYDLTPLWRLDLLLLNDMEHPSLFFAPRLKWSAAANMNLTFLLQWPGGTARGEFARLNSLAAVQLDWYF